MERLQGGVAVDPREAPVRVEHLALAQHRGDAAGLGPLDHRVEERRLRVEIRIGDLVPVDQDEVGALADLDRAEAVAVGGGAGAADGRHPQHLRHARHVGLVHAGHPVGAQHEAHLLEHVAVVVDAGLVEADRRVDALRLEPVERRHAGAQPEVRRAIVADAGAGRRHPLDVGFVEPDAVAERQARTEHPEPVEVLEGGAAAALLRVGLLVGGLHEVHVHRHVVGFGQAGEPFEGRVGAPVQVGGRQLDLGPRGTLLAGMQAAEEREIVLQGHLEALEPALHRVLQRRRQARHEIHVGLVDETVLVADREAVRDPHADVAIGAQHLVGARLDLLQAARHPAVDVLDRGDPGADHLEGRVEGVEVEVQVARHHAGDEPQLQGHVG